MKNYLNNRNQIVGDMRDDKIYRTKRSAKKHLLRVMDAWGLDVEIKELLALDGCEEIRIRDEDSGTVYKVAFARFCELAVERNFGNRQLFLMRRYFEAIPPMTRDQWKNNGV